MQAIEITAPCCLCCTALRVNEVNQLEANDIDFDNLTIMLAGAKNKNRKTRAVPMTKKVAEELRMLIGPTTCPST